jgi:hypothetical protein
MSGIPFNGSVSSEEELQDAIATGIADRMFYIAGMEELRYIWADTAASESRRLKELETFAGNNGWRVTAQRHLTGALFETKGREVFSPAIWRAAEKA